MESFWASFRPCVPFRNGPMARGPSPRRSRDVTHTTWQEELQEAKVLSANEMKSFIEESSPIAML